VLDPELEPRSNLVFAEIGVKFFSKQKLEAELEPCYVRIDSAPDLLQIKN